MKSGYSVPSLMTGRPRRSQEARSAGTSVTFSTGASRVNRLAGSWLLADMVLLPLTLIKPAWLVVSGGFVQCPGGCLRLRVAGLRGGFALRLGVGFGAEEDGHAGEGAVGFAVGAELGDVEREAERGQQEDRRGGEAAGADPLPAWCLPVGPVKVVEGEQQRDGDDREDPADRGPGDHDRGSAY